MAQVIVSNPPAGALSPTHQPPTPRNRREALVVSLSRWRARWEGATDSGEKLLQR